MNTDSFEIRHIGPNSSDTKKMLKVVGASSLDALIDETVPRGIRLGKTLDLPPGISEAEFMAEAAELARQNEPHRSFIGQGYYNTHTPAPILRNVLHNPGWYTQYTPYQAEISQGRLEALLNFQTMVKELTGLGVANASLLDEATAAFEAMTMCYRLVNRRAKQPKTKFFVSQNVFPSTMEVLKSRAPMLEIEVVAGEGAGQPDDSYFGAFFQYPDAYGKIDDFKAAAASWKAVGAMVVMASDLMALCVIEPPGRVGADIAVGSTQRFGVPMFYGGPHAAFMATSEAYIREMPGRIIGVSVDSQGHQAYRMTLQTREQHIKREKATSNICTAQALLAIMASMYAVYHGPEGLQRIAGTIHKKARFLDKSVSPTFKLFSDKYFDTVRFEVRDQFEAIKKRASEAKYNFFWCPTTKSVQISIDESVTEKDLCRIVGILIGKEPVKCDWSNASAQLPMPRNDAPLSHGIFSMYHSETELVRYLKKLENKDLSLTLSMIPLGSCTMKLNPAACMLALNSAGFTDVHPFAPTEQNKGYAQLIKKLEAQLAEITGFAAVSLQPNSGAQGEYAGLRVIQAYHESRGDKERDLVLIPASSHGTNPASASVCGMSVVIVEDDEHGNVDIEDLKTKAAKHQDKLAGLMITYPSTHGVFEESIVEVCRIIHQHGGQVYMDGANMNAQVGLTSPGHIGADVCHLNLHKTFSIPHGGGGPGVGPICVAKHLAPFLPGHPMIKTGGEKAVGAISQAPWGSAGILPISYGYIRMLGASGCTNATRMAILNANYIKARLEPHYNILFKGRTGRVAHELIIDIRPFRAATGIEAVDISKRLMDYSFHSPTLSFPVSGTLMIEPTESESLKELDRFCDALIHIREEIREIEQGKYSQEDNVLKNAPHSALLVASDKWPYSYGREKAVYPLPSLRLHKFWLNCSRINDAHGDRNLICSCPPLSSYQN